MRLPHPFIYSISCWWKGKATNGVFAELATDKVPKYDIHELLSMQL